ncbi:MAG: hypothetical protein KF894_11200 [Labilithrix sp.]|nr:hypothetical protein [Labilithrix sp.]
MLLTASVSKAEVVALVDALTPMRVFIDERRRRVVTLNRAEVTFVAGRGIRLRGDARAAWDVAGVELPVTVQAWQVLLVPHVVARGRARLLALEPVVEELELGLVPGFVDDKIARAVREGIAQKRERLAWDFARALSKRLALSARIAPPRALEIVAADGEVDVGEDELRLGVRFEARVVERRVEVEGAPSEREPAMPLVPAPAGR